MPVDKMPVDKMPVDKMPVDKMPVDQMSADDIKKCCQGNVGRQIDAALLGQGLPDFFWCNVPKR
jgi:hypothetical protein